MTTISLRSARYTFMTLMTALTLFVVAESAVGGRAAPTARDEGLSTCGSMHQPCALEAVAVEVTATTPAGPQLAEGLTACGSEAQPCLLEAVQVAAPASGGLLASAERSMGMALRVKS